VKSVSPDTQRRKRKLIRAIANEPKAAMAATTTIAHTAITRLLPIWCQK